MTANDGGFRLATTLTGVVSVEALRGADYGHAQAVTLRATGDGAWAGSAASEAKLLVRLVLADGSVIETAPGDF